MTALTGEGIVYSTVIPTCFSGEALLQLVSRLNSVFRETLCAPHEVILVNDGCFDERHLAVLERCHVEHGAKIIHLSRNFGKPGALMAGFNNVSGQYVVTLDDDLQQLPEDIVALAALRKHDVVMAAYSNRKHSRFIRWSSLVKHQFDRVVLGRAERMTPLKLIRRHVVDAVATMGGSRPYLPGLLVSVTSDIVTVDLEHQFSAYGQSRYTLLKRISQFSGLIINTTSLPLRVAAAVGGLIAAGSVILAFIFAIRKLAGLNPPTGWTSLMFAILFLGGTILLTLGLIGEYLIRILEVVSERRAYHVRSKIGFPPYALSEIDRQPRSSART